MFENIMKFFKKANKREALNASSKETAKERLHLVLMQDRANVSADFLDLMRQEIIEVIKKYIDIDESAMDVRLTNKENEDGSNGAPALYANIPILNIKDEVRQTAQVKDNEDNEEKKEDKEIEDKTKENKVQEDKEQKGKEQKDKAQEDKTQDNNQELEGPKVEKKKNKTKDTKAKKEK